MVVKLTQKQAEFLSTFGDFENSDKLKMIEAVINGYESA